MKLQVGKKYKFRMIGNWTNRIDTYVNNNITFVLDRNAIDDSSYIRESFMKLINLDFEFTCKVVSVNFFSDESITMGKKRVFCNIIVDDIELV